MTDAAKPLAGKIAGGHLLAKAMADKGIKRIFSVCGGFINPAYMGCEQFGIEVIGCRNELEAGFMAAATARLTREVAVCLVEPSGFTNYVSGVAEAHYTGAPVIFITAVAASSGSTIRTRNTGVTENSVWNWGGFGAGRLHANGPWAARSRETSLVWLHRVAQTR
jgi:acetolactate synthase-1/2/3 large subunit